MIGYFCCVTPEEMIYAAGALPVKITGSTESLQEVTEADLSPTGNYAALGADAGMGRPLTIEEALTE